MKSKALQTIPTADGIRLELPHRQLGEYSKFGLFLVIFCSFAILFLLFWTAIWLRIGLALLIEEGQLLGVAVAAVSIIGFCGIFFAAKFATLGWLVAKDRTSCHVVLNSKYLISAEQLGIFKWRRKVRTDSITRLGVFTDPRGRSKDLLTISATHADAKQFLVAPGYPMTVLQQVISEIGTQINRQRSPQNQIQISTEPEVRLDPSDEYGISNKASTPESGAEFMQPADSKITVYDRAGTDSFQVPPMGLRKGSKGLFGFSLFWNGFMAVFTTVLIIIVLADPPKGDPIIKGTGLLLAIAFLGLFWTIGIVSLVAAINAGKRSAMIGIADGQLFIERKSMFGTKWLEIPVDQVKQIAVLPSGTEINSIPIMQLQIHETNGNEHGLLSQLSNDDLHWIAQELRKSLADAQN